MADETYLSSLPFNHSILVDEISPYVNPVTQYNNWLTEEGLTSATNNNFSFTLDGSNVQVFSLPFSPWLSLGVDPCYLWVHRKGSFVFTQDDPSAATSREYALPDRTNVEIYDPQGVPKIFSYFNAGHYSGNAMVANTNLSYYQITSTTALFLLLIPTINDTYPILTAIRIRNGSMEVVGSITGFTSTYGRAGVAEWDNNVDDYLNITYWFTADNIGGAGTTIPHAIKAAYVESYAVSGSISEDLSINKFKISALSTTTLSRKNENAISIDSSANNGNYDFYFYNNEPCYVVATPDALIWTKDFSYNAGDLIFPTVVSNVPYYFEALTTGVSGSSEPTWNITVDGQTTDNTVTWIRRDHVVRPQIHGPLVPYLVV